MSSTGWYADAAIHRGGSARVGDHGAAGTRPAMQQLQDWDPVCARPTGLVTASRIDPTGKGGPTRRQAARPAMGQSRARLVRTRSTDRTAWSNGSSSSPAG